MHKNYWNSFRQMTFIHENPIQWRIDRMKVLMILVVLSCFPGCDASDWESDRRMTFPGSDRDAHGCISSAGYSWCEKEDKCARSWRLAKDQGFENTQTAFDRYCNQ